MRSLSLRTKKEKPERMNRKRRDYKELFFPWLAYAIWSLLIKMKVKSHDKIHSFQL